MTDYEYGIRNKQRNSIHRSGMTAAQAYRWITEDWESSQDQVHKLFEIVYRPTQSWTALTLPPKPAPLVCPECGEASDWIIAEHDPDDPWELDGEWWHDPLHDPNDLDSFVCSRRCYLPRYRRSKSQEITDAINSDPAEVERLKKARQDAREGHREPS